MEAFVNRFILILLLLSLFVIGCADSTNKKIKRDTLADIYADVLIVGSLYQAGEIPDAYEEQLDSVFAVHGVQRSDFESALEYYREDPRRWRVLIERVTKKLEERRDQIRDSSIRSSS